MKTLFILLSVTISLGLTESDDKLVDAVRRQLMANNYEYIEDSDSEQLTRAPPLVRNEPPHARMRSLDSEDELQDSETTTTQTQSYESATSRNTGYQRNFPNNLKSSTANTHIPNSSSSRDLLSKDSTETTVTPEEFLNLLIDTTGHQMYFFIDKEKRLREDSEQSRSINIRRAFGESGKKNRIDPDNSDAVSTGAVITGPATTKNAKVSPLNKLVAKLIKTKHDHTDDSKDVSWTSLEKNLIDLSSSESQESNKTTHADKSSSLRYKLLKVKADDQSGRRAGQTGGGGVRSATRGRGATRRLLQVEGGGHVAIVSLDGERPFPQFRLPKNRRQYMGESEIESENDKNMPFMYAFSLTSPPTTTEATTTTTTRPERWHRAPTVDYGLPDYPQSYPPNEPRNYVNFNPRSDTHNFFRNNNNKNYNDLYNHPSRNQQSDWSRDFYRNPPMESYSSPHKASSRTLTTTSTPPPPLDLLEEARQQDRQYMDKVLNQYTGSNEI